MSRYNLTISALHRSKALAALLTVCSVLGTAVAIEVTGGLPNQLVHLYYLPVVASALLLPRRWGILVAIIAMLAVSPAIDVLHGMLDKPDFYNNPSPWNLAGNGWIVRPIAFFAINLLASRVARSRTQLAASNDGLLAEVIERERKRAAQRLQTEVAERQRTAERLQTALATERELQAQLAHQALYDPLTGLPNRAMFRARLEHALALAEASDRSVGFIFLDIDDFKAVNDRWGHATGDEVLADLGQRIAACCSPSDTAARLGGDEFAIIVEQGVSVAAVHALAQRVIAALVTPIASSRGELFLRCSGAIALASSESRVDGTELFRRVDVTMHKAKQHATGSVEVFESALDAGLVARIELAQDMQRAIPNGEFVLHYQPSVALATGEILGLEALVRWQHPTLGLLQPDCFIPLAEENGQIEELGAWILGEGVRQLAEWQRTIDRPIFVAINVSARQLGMTSFVDDVRAVIARSGIDPARLHIEITETAIMGDPEQALLRLHGLKSLGVQLAIDDFGIGYSSLNYLRRIPVDVLKIDKAFVDELSTGDTKNDMLVRTIIDIGRSMNLDTVAEGIERPEQASTLISLGCLGGQGYHFARPMDAAAASRLLEEDGHIHLAA